MKAWIARDKDREDNLWIYGEKPVLVTVGKKIVWHSVSMIRLSPDGPLGEGVTFENSPQLVTLVKEIDKEEPHE